MISGAAGGIGDALARAFAARGARLVLADVDEPGLERRAKALEARGARVLAVPADVRRFESVERLAERALAHFGSLGIVCNNAGIAVAGELVHATAEDWERTMAVNFWGVVNGVRAFVPRLLAAGQGGQILNTASMAGLAGMQGLGVYSASKFAIVGLSEALHRELRPHGIHVSVLCPMMVDTAMTRSSLGVRPDSAPETGNLAGGIITPDEVARRALRGLERRDLYILTHFEQRAILQRRAARLDAMFEDDVWPLAE